MIATSFSKSAQWQQAAPQWHRVGRNAPVTATAPYYVFNNADGKGFVIVSGDDAAAPILGYATCGKFSYEDMPENLRTWMWMNEQYVLACSQRAATPRTTTMGTPIVQPLLGDISWGQGAPYNDMCPTYTATDGITHYYVGCVATATTQIMRYHQYPIQGSGTKTITVGGQQYSADFGGTTYDWEHMLPTYANVTASDLERTAVATLAAHFGIAVDMEYMPSIARLFLL